MFHFLGFHPNQCSGFQTAPCRQAHLTETDNYALKWQPDHLINIFAIQFDPRVSYPFILFFALKNCIDCCVRHSTIWNVSDELLTHTAFVIYKYMLRCPCQLVITKKNYNNLTIKSESTSLKSAKNKLKIDLQHQAIISESITTVYCAQQEKKSIALRGCLFQTIYQNVWNKFGYGFCFAKIRWGAYWQMLASGDTTWLFKTVIQ